MVGGRFATTKGQLYEVAQPTSKSSIAWAAEIVCFGFHLRAAHRQGARWALRCGVAHGALAMSTPGDTTMASLAEVLKLVRDRRED